MRKLSLILGILLSVVQLKAQDNPHGEKFQINCLDCHSTESWNFLAANAKFSHNSTSYKLEGQHIYTDCRACHSSLVFAEAKTNCMDCHTDLHKNTVGMDCARCHTPKSWLVQNITEIHQMSRFPLLGAHNSADCSACHVSASNLEFQPLGIECIDCHLADYQAANNPNHVLSQISIDCFDCHRVDAFEWRSRGFNHQFFPLSKGHEINDCARCHTSGIFNPISSDCISCHQRDFVSATNPTHNNQAFSTQCTDCHTTEPDWKPAKFDIHDNFYFPVFSGKHRGEWNSCADCHTSSSSYSDFSCITCHEHNQPEMDGKHRGVGGYAYESTRCLSCHPNGTEDD